MIRVAPALAGVLVLAGCAGTTPIKLDANHPANPDAPEAAPLSPSAVLSIRQSPAIPAASQPSTGHADVQENRQTHHGTTIPSEAGGQSRAIYTCPHHPEVVSDNPGRCPKCDMKLVKKEGGNGHAH